MQSFNALFPNFLARCVELKMVLTPLAYLLLIVGMISATITGRRSASESLRTIARTFIYVVLLTQIVPWGNQISLITDVTVKESLKVDPAKVFDDYKKTLDAKKSGSDDAGWWDKLFHLSSSFFEGLISALLWVFGFLASIIVFYAYLVQKFVLYLGYALSPIFIGFLAIRTLNSIGISYLLGLAGVMTWPLGWGAAAIVTQGLLDFMTDQSFLANTSLSGAAGYTFQNFIGVAVLGVWLIFSTIASPVLIQRAISSGIQIGSSLLSDATTAISTALTAGATGAAGFSSGGSAAAGIVGGLATGAMAMVGTSMSGNIFSPAGSLLPTLAQFRGGASQQSAQPPHSPFTGTDLAGDQAVKALINQSKKSS